MKRIGIAGATGLVGETLLRVLEQRASEIEELRLFASAKSAGTKLRFRDQEYEVQEVRADAFRGLDIAFFCLEPGLAKRLVPEVAKHCPVIDKSSNFRLREDVPLVVPEVNKAALSSHHNIIANPNCTTIPLVVAINPLHQRFGLEKLWIASYQSASGAGREAMRQLRYEIEFVAMDQQPDTRPSPLPAQLADNVIPQIDDFDSHGNTGEELKTIKETAKILDLPELRVNSTCVRVPVSIGHALAVTAKFSQPVKVKDALEALRHAPGVVLYDRDRYVTPVLARGNDNVYVSRVRQGADPDEISLWIVTDNLRKGAATNAVQIAEALAEMAPRQK